MAHTPFRTCIGCRASQPAENLSRIALNRNQPAQAVVDVERKLPGRGAWIHLETPCLTKALKKKALDRAFKTRVDTSRLEEINLPSTPPVAKQ